MRALALRATVDIFSAPSVTPAARADLKKEMIRLDVGRKVQDTILAAVLGGGLERAPSGTSLGASATSTTQATPSSREAASTTPRAKDDGTPSAVRPTTTSTPSLPTLPAAAFLADPSSVPGPILEIQPVYVASEKDLANEFEQMKPAFEGRESEHNWMARDRSVATMRGMVQGGVQEKFAEAFLAGVKGVQEGILKTVSSLQHLGMTMRG